MRRNVPKGEVDVRRFQLLQDALERALCVRLELPQHLPSWGGTYADAMGAQGGRNGGALALGAIAGGFVIAFSELAITFAYKKVVAYLIGDGVLGDGLLQLLSTDYKFAVSFMILVIVLLVKPTGIFSGKTL